MKITLPSLSWVRWPWSERSKSRWNGMHMVENLDVFLDKPLGGIHVFGGKDFEPGPSLGSSSTRHPHPVEPIVDRRVGDLESSPPAPSSVQGRSTPRNGATSDDSSLRELESASLWRVQAVHPDRRSDERALHPIASLPTHPCRKRSLSAPRTLSSLEVSSEVLRKSTSTSQLSSTRTRSTHLSPYRDTLEGDPRIFSTATITITSSDNTHIGSGRKGNDRGKLTWPQELYMMCAKMIGVSMLAMPKTFAELGVLGAVVFVVVGAVLSFIGARAIWEFKMAHPHVRNMAELLETLFSPWGQSMSRFGYWLGLILTTVFNLVSARFVLTNRSLAWILTFPRALWYNLCSTCRWWHTLLTMVRLYTSRSRQLLLRRPLTGRTPSAIGPPPPSRVSLWPSFAS